MLLFYNLFQVLVTEAGIKQSFSMTLNIEHYEYYVDTKDSGLRLIIHDQNETPVRFRGLALSPGFTTYVEITKRKVSSLHSFCQQCFLFYSTTFSINKMLAETTKKSYSSESSI